MVVHQIPGLGGGVGLSHLPQAPEEDKEAGEEVGEEKKDVIIEVLGDIGRLNLTFFHRGFKIPSRTLFIKCHFRTTTVPLEPLELNLSAVLTFGH